MIIQGRCDTGQGMVVEVERVRIDGFYTNVEASHRVC